MKKKIKNINAMNLIWLFIYLLPMLLCFGWVLINRHASITNVYSLSDFIHSIYTNLSYDIPIFNTLESVIDYLGFNGSVNEFILIMLSYVTYLVLVVFVRILFDVLVMLPNIIHNFIDRIGGERE